MSVCIVGKLNFEDAKLQIIFTQLLLFQIISVKLHPQLKVNYYQEEKTGAINLKNLRNEINKPDMEKIIREIQKELGKKNSLPDFKAGDTITVNYKIKEGAKERIQQFQGVVIQRTGRKGVDGTFTVRKISSGIGVERIFPVSSPFIESVEINKHGSVRRAKIFYMRKLTGKASRIKEKIMAVSEVPAIVPQEA